MAAIHRYGMFPPGARIGAAVSGGADSVCLLHLLVELAPRFDLRLTVLHLDHMLRGEESRADARFVADLAGRLGLPVRLEQTDVARLAGESGDNLEQAARHARRQFFRRFLDAGDLDRVALGHTRSDPAETVLFRFLRGAGTAGLAGIRPVTADGFVRPLLDIDRAEVERYLRERAIPWREDSSNQTLEFARNRIRHDLLPRLARDWNPALAETLARTADWALAEEAWWDGEIDRLEERHLMRKPPAVYVRADSLRELPLAVVRRLARRAIERVRGDLRGVGFEHIEAVLAMAALEGGHGRVQIPGVDVYRSFEWLRLAPPGLDNLENRNFRMPLAVPGRVQEPGGGPLLSLEVIEKSDSSETPDCGYNKDVSSVDWGRVPDPLALRNWRPGDQYRPVGHSQPVKIKTLFQEARVPLWERRNWPIVTCGEAIVWARLFGPAADYVADSNTRSILLIRELAP